jgi:hypothetical protein
MIPVTVQVSTGYTVNADFSQTPAYKTFDLKGQKQALTSRELEHISGLNLQGILCAMYISGSLEGIDRPLGKGGDLVLEGGRTWKVVQVFETWPDWCRVALCLQQ